MPELRILILCTVKTPGVIYNLPSRSSVALDPEIQPTTDHEVLQCLLLKKKSICKGIQTFQTYVVQESVLYNMVPLSIVTTFQILKLLILYLKVYIL